LVRRLARPIPTAAVVALLLALVCGSYAVFVRGRSPTPEPADDPWSQAQRALAEDHLPQAIGHLRRTLATRPFYAKARFLLARASRRSDDVAGWQHHLYRAEALQWPRDEIDLERRLLRAQSGSLRDIDPVLLSFLDSFHSDTGLILEAIVKGFLESYRLQEAVSWANRWLERYPEDYRSWLYHGRAFYLNGTRQQALADYRRAWELKPDQPSLRLWLAAALMLDGQFSEALAHFEASLREQPDQPNALLGAANCLLELNRKDEAQARLDELLSRQPTNAAALLVRARLELDRDAPAEALSWLRRAEAAAPQDPGIVHALVLAYRQLGRRDEAEQYQRRQNELQELTQRFEEARKRAILEPESVALRYEVGALCLRLGHDEEAVRWFESALLIDANHQPSHQALADWYQKQGDVRRSEAHRRASVRD
jgi:tetratricopeptide (TPR) repeat protein